MNDDRMILASEAEGAINDITDAFLEAINAVVTDPELANDIKLEAQNRLLTKALQALMGPSGGMTDARDLLN